ncbi:cbb3-type cytochrome c oxidase subunit II [Sulfuriroseicoccus oceanibius]|uniref:Cbb3-type cytochrome c oxidase subunit II n=1 Tax=Sulfuriroseicoccus oceanibius TaxID=2707525 RepID=A0A6B3LBS8_9BACT|nr:cbb3-type cytochrome c oxidase subunit II [Sulfuriroseicoccus oceanibius]QQL44633.1 cbb3-type cytochrome c oxidase subunit II [Sulfuriroseicoccus oceanibius]
MSVRTFYLGLIAAFALPWVFFVALPYGEIGKLDTTLVDDVDGSVYPEVRAGMVAAGARVYAQEGCVQCHSQMIRPTYAGPDRWRDGWVIPGEERETVPQDYHGEKYAALGVQRIGPDLSNLYIRYNGEDAKQQLMLHLYNPRSVAEWSNMPSYKHLFEKRRIQGQQSADALPVEVEEGYEVVPTDRAEALVSYLVNLRKDAPVAPAAEEEEAK